MRVCLEEPLSEVATLRLSSEDITLDALSQAVCTSIGFAHEANAMTEKSIDVTIYLKFILFSDVAL